MQGRIEFFKSAMPSPLGGRHFFNALTERVCGTS
jgi:hypothetical protein